MKNFARALKEAWRHWPALAAAICCSMGVAALWGVNIAALFPIIETTLNGKSLQEWNRQRQVDGAGASSTANWPKSRQLDEQIAAAARRRAPQLSCSCELAARTRSRD